MLLVEETGDWVQHGRARYLQYLRILDTHLQSGSHTPQGKRPSAKRVRTDSLFTPLYETGR